MKRLQLWGLLSVCSIMFSSAFGIELETNIRDNVDERCSEELVIIVDEKEGLPAPMVRSLDFEPCEFDMQDFFGEVEDSRAVVRSQPVEFPAWKEKLFPLFMKLVLWYEAAEKKARHIAVIGCELIERALRCESE